MIVSGVAATEKKSFLRYPGGKGSGAMSTWIVRHFAEHQVYVEPFGGGASVLLRKEPSPLEVYNDLFDGVVALFRCLRDRPDELVRAIDLTPFSLREWELSQRPTKDELEAARRFYVRSWQSYGGYGGQKWRTGWLRQKKADPGERLIRRWGETDHLLRIARRLKQVSIDSIPATECIKRYDSTETLFYLDPPYAPESRGRWAQNMYEHEMTAHEHRELSRLLHGIQGMALLSGYACELYEDLYGDWLVDKRLQSSDGGNIRTECLWISPALQRRLTISVQTMLPLFVGGGVLQSE